MKVKEVVMLAAYNLGREDLAREASIVTHPTGELQSLLRCYNLVENEIALDYLPLKREDKVQISEGKGYYTALSCPPVELLSVKTAGGEKVNFTVYSAYFTVDRDEGELTVEYCYTPAEKGWQEESALGGKISARLLALGVTSEFCLSRGQFSEAAIWQKRYQEALRAASFRRARRRMRSRRWV